MWTTIYNRHATPLPGAWTAFKEEITGEHQPIVKIEFLNSYLNPIGEFIYSTGSDNSEVTNLVSDGNIDVDVERGTRRTGEITLLNPTAEFTPATADFEPEGDWVGYIYLNRIVRVWRGVKVGGMEMYVPVGTFMIDGCEVIVEQNMSLTNMTLSDMWKKLTKSYYGTEKVYQDGTTYNEIIRDMIDFAGVPLSGAHAAVLDKMASRDAAEKRISRNLKFQVGDSRGDRLKELVKQWGLDAYFDPMGTFRTEDRQTAKDRTEVWTFSSKEIGDDGRNGGLVSLTRSFNDDNLYNHVIVIGTGDEKNTVKSTRADTSKRSKTSVNRIGDRVYLLESDRIDTQAKADRAMKKAWDRRFQLSETITCETVCNPCLEADDMIRIEERDFAKIDGKYRLRRFNVPLVTSRQTIEVANIIRDEDL